MKNYSYRIPERRIGEIFSYKGDRYQVMDGSEQPLYDSKIGCTTRDPETGNVRNLCAFADCCGRVNRRHRGYCAPYERQDNKTVYFKKQN
jgi:hypothetical protein